jgi:hypothetical protein
MAAAMTLTNKSSLVNSSKHSSPIINQRESYSPASSSTTLSPESSNSISSPDKSLLLNNTFNDDQQQQQQQSIRLVDYFVVAGLDKYLDVEPSCELPGMRIFLFLYLRNCLNRRTSFKSISMFISMSCIESLSA